MSTTLVRYSMTGKKQSPEAKEKIRQALLGRKRPELTNEKNPYWKGDKVGYHGLHKWVSRHLGKPTTCEHCGKTGLTGMKIHWANKSHEYKRDLTDWLRLCVSCHRLYDYKYERGRNVTHNI